MCKRAVIEESMKVLRRGEMRGSVQSRAPYGTAALSGISWQIDQIPEDRLLVSMLAINMSWRHPHLEKSVVSVAKRTENLRFIILATASIKLIPITIIPNEMQRRAGICFQLLLLSLM